ncbi:light-regulated signal transduction histidine kinase (bacteriophytochrome) [Flavobacterium sp. 28A]|uniref:ATP-binding protein n=1 Tax=Flavobacterium sp. 28A TaxID=2735895 RepID=UPI00156F7819|nr:ATP-binding protein [Flavobacterium sp. 28A]NRT14866.1 light-regulated signal transduction histidine kinase (bacteriophytochrome) [Flavobacterium sp. 28A]
MSFKNILNNSLVDLNNCEDEPIHIPGAIQPHGFLLSIDSQTTIITVCSENSSNFIGLNYEKVLGQKVSLLFNNEMIASLQDFKIDCSNQVKTFNYKLNNTIFLVSMHAAKDQIILEFEPLNEQFDERNDLFNSSKQLLSYIENTHTLIDLAQVVTTAVKNITQYDRVMVYRFDKEYNGEVIAESKESFLEPYLGLHYPHTDIPAQARELYIKNHLRIIGDVNYIPVPLYKLNEAKFETLDLSMSILRSVSPIHIEYLKNMHVGSTLTISLIHKNKLWGLITCHHSSPKFLSDEIKSAVKLHGHFITSQIDVRLLNEEYEVAKKANAALRNLTSRKSDISRDGIKELIENKAILELCNSDGFTAVIGNEVYQFGETPADENSKRLALFLSEFVKEDNFYTDSLFSISNDLSFISSHFPGINYYSLNNDFDCIIWYRNQTIKEINWAGNPTKGTENIVDKLTPRKSFAKFIENVKDHSRIWLNSELSACENFYNFLQMQLRSIVMQEDKENQRKLTEILKDTNAELENINWISTHDLQEPLRKIRMMASVLIGGNELQVLPEDVQNKILKMQNSAERMQNLITDILKYTKTGAQNSNFEIIDLNALFVELNEEELVDSFTTNKATLVIEKLPNINGVPFLLKQLFSNIINNSIKFKSLDESLFIKISDKSTTLNSHPRHYHIIEIEDNGIGFENEYKEKIFKIFSRLNSKEDYDGSGIGLALCKKIMSKHDGFITADGALGKGVKIHLYFPVN